MRRYVELIRAWWRFVALVALPVVILAILMTRAGSLPFVREFVTLLQAGAHEWWAVPLFVVAYVVFAVLMLPVGLLSFVAALAWGWAAGGAIELATSTIAATVPYLLARGPGAGFVKRRLEKFGAGVPAFHGSDGAFALLLLRIVPILPYVALNYVAGLARVKPRDFVLTTFFGSIPSVFVFAWFVDTMASRAMGVASQARMFAACGAIALLVIIGRLLAKRFSMRLP